MSRDRNTLIDTVYGHFTIVWKYSPHSWRVLLNVHLQEGTLTGEHLMQFMLYIYTACKLVKGLRNYAFQTPLRIKEQLRLPCTRGHLLWLPQHTSFWMGPWPSSFVWIFALWLLPAGWTLRAERQPFSYLGHWPIIFFQRVVWVGFFFFIPATGNGQVLSHPSSSRHTGLTSFGNQLLSTPEAGSLRLHPSPPGEPTMTWTTYLATKMEQGRGVMGNGGRGLMILCGNQQNLEGRNRGTLFWAGLLVGGTLLTYTYLNGLKFDYIEFDFTWTAMQIYN